MEVLRKAYIVSPYEDDRGSYSHTGVDVLSGVSDRSVFATAKGKVIEAQNRMEDSYIVNENSPVSEWAGNYIILEHGNGYTSRYSHLAYNTLTVKVGDIIEEGTIIANEGESGYATGVHLDFEVKKDGNFVNPTDYALGKANLPAYGETGGDQVLRIGSIVRIDRILTVTSVNEEANLIGITDLTGQTNEWYHWFDPTPFIVVDDNGNKTENQVCYIGCKVKLTGEYEVLGLALTNAWACELKIGDRYNWVWTEPCYEIKD